MSSLRKNYSKVTQTERSFFIRQGTTDGLIDGDGSANIDGSVTPVNFYITPNAGDLMEVVELSIELSDGGTPSIDEYGNIGSALTNGVQIFLERDGVATPLGLPIVDNRGLINLGPELTYIELAANERVVKATFNIRDFAKNGVTLDSTTGDKLGIIIQDDLSTLIEHSVIMKGNVKIGNIDELVV